MPLRARKSLRLRSARQTRELSEAGRTKRALSWQRARAIAVSNERSLRMKSKQNSMARCGTSTTSLMSSDISLASRLCLGRNCLRCPVHPDFGSSAAEAATGAPAQAQQPSSARHDRTSSSFLAMMSGSRTSAPIRRLVGYKTPNIDRIAREGMMFTDYYAENSCTAGRSTFITGQVCLRTGLCKVGIPGATVGLQDRDITIAQALKPLGYATGQFGKDHLGDRDEFLPTNTASTSSSATSTTSTLRRNRSDPTIRRTIQISSRPIRPVAFSSRLPMARSRTPDH